MNKATKKIDSSWQTARQILKLLSPKERILVGLTLVIRLGVVSLDLVGIFLIGVVVSLLSGTTIAASSPLTQVLNWLREHGVANGYAVIMATGVAFFIAKGIISALLNRTTSLYVAEIEWEKSLEVAKRLLSSELSRVEKWSTQDLIFGATGSVASATTQAIMIGSVVIGEVALLVAVSIYLAISNWVLFVSIATFFAVVGWLMNQMVSRASVKAAKSMHDTNQASHGLLLDFLANFRQLALSPNRWTVLGKFSEYRREAASQGAKYQTITGLPRYITEIAVMLGVGILVFQRAWGDPSAASAAVIAVFLAGIFRIVSSMLPLQAAISSWKLVEHQARIALEILDQSLDENPSDLSGNGHGYEAPFGVSAHDLSFEYATKSDSILKSLNFEISPGEFVALVGPSGSGKSTLADLIVGLRRPTTGRVMITEIDARDFVRKNPGAVAYVPQETPLLSGSLRQNVSLNFEAETPGERKRVKVSLQAAGLEGFESSFENGLDAQIGPEYQSLSGGQKQRIGLARALYTGPGLIVLDEATSALDQDSQDLIQETIDNLRGKVTLVVIAHREETIRNADQLLTLQLGELK